MSGFLRVKNLLSATVFLICGFAAFGACFGPGIDAPSLHSALAFGAFGAWVGYTGAKGTTPLIGAFMGAGVGSMLGDAAGIAGLVSAAAFGRLVVWYSELDDGEK